MKGIYKAIDANVISELEIIDQSFVQMKNSGSLKWEIEVEMNGRYELYFVIGVFLVIKRNEL